MDTAIQPMRPYTQGKLKDPSKQFLYAAPFTADRFTLESKGAARDSLTARIAQAAAALDDSMADGIVIDMFHGPFSTILAILPNGATRSTRTWDHEVHFTRQVLAAVNMHDPAIYPEPRFIAPILAPANPWFGNWGEADGCRSQAAMMTQAEFYHRIGWETFILDHEARWSVNGWGLQQVTPEDIARLREEDEL